MKYLGGTEKWKGKRTRVTFVKNVIENFLKQIPIRMEDENRCMKTWKTKKLGSFVLQERVSDEHVT